MVQTTTVRYHHTTSNRDDHLRPQQIGGKGIELYGNAVNSGHIFGFGSSTSLRCGGRWPHRERIEQGQSRSESLNFRFWVPRHQHRFTGHLERGKNTPRNDNARRLRIVAALPRLDPTSHCEMADLCAQGEGGAGENPLWIKGAVFPSPSG